MNINAKANNQFQFLLLILSAFLFKTSNLKTEEARLSSSLLNTIFRQIWYQSKSDYRTRAIITRGLYTFYPLFEVQKRFFKGLFS